jgi:hypothetical protein
VYFIQARRNRIIIVCRVGHLLLRLMTTTDRLVTTWPAASSTNGALNALRVCNRILLVFRRIRLVVASDGWLRHFLPSVHLSACRGQLKCDGTRAVTKFRLSAKRASPFKSAEGVSSVDYWQPRCAPSAVVMLDTPCSEVVWRILVTHSIRKFPLHFPFRASPCAITFQLESSNRFEKKERKINVLSSFCDGNYRMCIGNVSIARQ